MLFVYTRWCRTPSVSVHTFVLYELETNFDDGIPLSIIESDRRGGTGDWGVEAYGGGAVGSSPSPVTPLPSTTISTTLPSTRSTSATSQPSASSGSVAKYGQVSCVHLCR